MTEIRYRFEDDCHHLQIQGHSGFGGHGGDIVCAAVSMLGQTLLQCLIDAESRGDLKTLRHSRGDGALSAAALPVPAAREPVRVMFETVLTGLEMLAGRYPECVAYRNDSL